jgi:hypothetical protein
LSFIDVATGSLGQGLSCSAGMAYVGKYVDKSAFRVYCLIGDGESAEGSIWEAAGIELMFLLLYRVPYVCRESLTMILRQETQHFPIFASIQNNHFPESGSGKRWKCAQSIPRIKLALIGSFWKKSFSKKSLFYTSCNFSAFASYYKLDNLVAIVDVNRLGQSQATQVHFFLPAKLNKT